MSQFKKTLERLKLKPRDFSYDEVKYVLGKLGFVEKTKGKTSGSRVYFYRPEDKEVINLHRPHHPDKTMKAYALTDLVQKLEELGEL